MPWIILILLGLALYFRAKSNKMRDLITLRLTVKHMLNTGSISEEEAKVLLDMIDSATGNIVFNRRNNNDQDWDVERLNLAWRTLAKIEGIYIGDPPWLRKTQVTPKEELQGATPEEQPDTVPEKLSEPACPDTPEIISEDHHANGHEFPAEANLTESSPKDTTPLTDIRASQTTANEPVEQVANIEQLPIEAVTPKETDEKALSYSDVDTEEEISPQTTAQNLAEGTGEDGFQHAWEPAKLSPLEQALFNFSRWPKAFLPFLVQNVGWFIGTFCFVTGSIFLVAYTTGIIKSLVIISSLCAYTLFLIWGGYQLRVKRKDLSTASGVLLTTGMLLVPLNFSAITRMMVESGDRWWLVLLSLMIAVLAIGVFYFASQLISGVTDRALQGEHPRLFLLLALIQLCVPLVVRWPTWPLLALPHTLLLAAVAYGLLRYSQSWMYSIFVEKKKIAYYAAGTLLYAAVISFVHTTWGATALSIPNGYYGPYLMAICGLLFYLDAQFKEWADQHVFLSRFTFFIYGLSVLAVILVLETPAARLITLVLSASIYCVVTWKYITLIPLYLLLASLMGIYHQIILQHASWDWYFLLSLPGLIGLATFSRGIATMEAVRPGAHRIALMSYRLLMLLSFLLISWSLYFSHQGILAVLSALLFASLVWWELGYAPGSLLPSSPRQKTEVSGTEPETNLRNTPWLYLVNLSVAIAVFFIPPLTGTAWEQQSALGLVLLAWPWSYFALEARRATGCKLARKVEVYTNSALLTIVAGLTWIFTYLHPGGTLEYGLQALILLSAAGVVLWLSLSLYSRGLFYFFVLLASLDGLFIKLTFFPGPSTGLPLLILGIGIWFLIWWLSRQPDELVQLRIKRAQESPPLTLLWFFPLAVTGKSTSSDGISDLPQHRDSNLPIPEDREEKEGGKHV